MAPEILRLVIFITPIYILLLLMDAQQAVTAWQRLFWAALCVRLSMAWLGTGQFCSPVLLAAAALSPYFSCERFLSDREAQMAEYPCLKPI